MAYIYLLQLAKSSFGYKQYINNKDEELLKFGIFRTKICDNLFENAKDISNRLLKLSEISE